MKKKNIIIIAVITIGLFTACNQNSTKENDNTSNTTTESTNTVITAEQSDNTNDGRLNNVGKAKMPKGKMSYVIDGQTVSIDENMVQCMYVGMNSSMAQAVISGGSPTTNQVVIVHMGMPSIGEVDTKNKYGIASVSIQIIINGTAYSNIKDANIKYAITKITKDGKNYYVAGTFSGNLKSADGKSVKLSNGVFESAYL
jgi:hypothetical protein